MNVLQATQHRHKTGATLPPIEGKGYAREDGSVLPRARCDQEQGTMARIPAASASSASAVSSLSFLPDWARTWLS